MEIEGFVLLFCLSISNEFINNTWSNSIRFATTRLFHFDDFKSHKIIRDSEKLLKVHKKFSETVSDRLKNIKKKLFIKFSI
jgi:hypothetical protein